MSLRASLAKQQRKGARFFVDLAQCFHENALIRESWEAMARDLDQQADSLQSIPARFWTGLRDAERVVAAAVNSCPTPEAPPAAGDHSLLHCFDLALQFEEPLTLTVYAPLIRRLRKESRGHALDFYVMVKAHLTRMLRLIQPFAGDPRLIQRAGGIIESFEREVQAPEAVAVAPPALKKAAQTGRKSSVRPAATGKTALTGRAEKVARRSKPLVGKINLRRGRARA
jgi:hypothetical protein